MRLADFEASLSGAEPPPDLSPALRGIWWALRGEWDRAHQAVQPSDDDCSWVHAILHREEGDLGNAGYWYRRAGRETGQGDLRAEYLAAAEVLLSQPS